MTTISLGGVWEDLHCRLKAAVDGQLKAETLLKDTIQEKEALATRIELVEVITIFFLFLFLLLVSLLVLKMWSEISTCICTLLHYYCIIVFNTKNTKFYRQNLRMLWLL